MSDDRDNYVPPEQRHRDHAPLDPSDLEFLDRLVFKGEALLLKGIPFKQAAVLLQTGHARIVRSYGVDDELTLIEPTESGRTLADIREKAKLARLEVPAPTLLKKE